MIEISERGKPETPRSLQTDEAVNEKAQIKSIIVLYFGGSRGVYL